MKVSSLAKDETIYLLELYKKLQQIEEALDAYINDTAVPEVSNIKKALEVKQKTDDEATELLNSSVQVKDTKKMIALLEEYINSSNEIEVSNRKAAEIMEIIEQLEDEKRKVESEIKALDNAEKVEIKFDEIEVVQPKKSKIINCDIRFNNNIISEYNKSIKVSLNSKNDNTADKLIKMVEEHLNNKTIEEDEKLHIVEMNNEPKKEEEVENLPIQQIIDLDNKVTFEEEPINNIEESNEESIEEKIESNIPEEEVKGDEVPAEITTDEVKETVVEEPLQTLNIDNIDIPNTEEVKEEENNYVSISDIINEEPKVEEPIVSIDPLDKQFEEMNAGNTAINTEIKEENVKYTTDEIQDKKIAKVPSNKKDKVGTIWEGSFVVPTIKYLEPVKTEEIIEEKEEVSEKPISFDSFVTGKTA